VTGLDNSGKYKDGCDWVKHCVSVMMEIDGNTQ